jgi:hypothetical protein
MSIRALLLLLVSLVVATPAASAPAAQGTDPQPAGRSIADFIERERDAAGAASGSQAGDLLPEVPNVAALGALDPETRDAAVGAIREYYRYRQSGYEHRRRVFDWQLLSSKIIFWIVVLMVSAGIYFSGVQFHLALRAVRPPAAASASAPPAFDTSLEAGAGGIKVSSPVLGVIILVISFLFFYLYLVHVYPISEIM